MFKYSKKRWSVYPAIGILLLLCGNCILIAIRKENLEFISGMVLTVSMFGIPILFFIGFESNILKGRFTAINTIHWFLGFLIVIGVPTVFVGLNNTLFKIDIYGLFALFTLIIWVPTLSYFVIKFFQLFYKRFQDFNQPGYYLFLGIVPILCWFIGISIFCSGRKVLGILVLLNLFLWIPYILFFRGDSETNYFGMHPKYKRQFNNDKKKIVLDKFLTPVEKKEMLGLLIKSYSEMEENMLKTFTDSELQRMIDKEQSKFDRSLTKSITQNKEIPDYQDRIKQYYTEKIDKKVNRFYSYSTWQ